MKLNKPLLINNAIEQNMRLKKEIFYESNPAKVKELQNRIALNNIMINKLKGGEKVG